jgi:hypothetical protein
VKSSWDASFALKFLAQEALEDVDVVVVDTEVVAVVIIQDTAVAAVDTVEEMAVATVDVVAAVVEEDTTREAEVGVADGTESLPDALLLVHAV